MSSVICLKAVLSQSTREFEQGLPKSALSCSLHRGSDPSRRQWDCRCHARVQYKRRKARHSSGRAVRIAEGSQHHRWLHQLANNCQCLGGFSHCSQGTPLPGKIRDSRIVVWAFAGFTKIINIQCRLLLIIEIDERRRQIGNV